MIYAVIDTNVLVSALFTKNSESPTKKVIEAIFNGKIKPLLHKDIISEYDEVLHRDKSKFSEENIQTLITSIKDNGIEVFPNPTGEILIDMDDLIFYEVAMEKRDDNSYLVTGNQKHYPIRDFIVTPSEMISILEKAS